MGSKVVGGFPTVSLLKSTFTSAASTALINSATAAATIAAFLTITVVPPLPP